MGEKKDEERLALIVFHDIKDKKLKSLNCATTVPLNYTNSESSLPSNTKRAGSISGTTYENMASNNLMKMGFTQKKSKKNKPNEHWKEHVDEGGT